MEKFGMSFGGGPSRKELLETVETQKQQLLRFQARLKDVVCAYKSLLKEKEALEASLKALSSSHHHGDPAPPPAARGSERGSERGSDGAGPAAGGDEEDAAPRSAEGSEGSEGAELCPGPDSERRLQQLRAQLATLTAALATVTREKSRMEASYQAERRQVRQELEEAERRGAELRELLLRAEREEPGEREQRARRPSREPEELQGAREESGKPDPRVQELQEEVAALKNHFQLQLVQEMKKTAQAEEQLRQRSQREERRVAELEAQVSQVSELLGTYEKAKQRDQGTIQRLRERVAQLDLENRSLAAAASARPPGDAAAEESALDVAALKEKMEKLRKLLRAAAGKGPEAPEEPSPGDEDEDKAAGGHCQQEPRQLKDEFERSKVRAQQVLKSKATKDVGQAGELEEAREQLAELRDKHVLLQLAADDAEERHRRELEAKRQELSRLQRLHRQELERCQLQFRERALRLEEEMHKQRDRALAVLAEKDGELERLRALAPPRAAPEELPGREPSEILPRELQPCPGSEPTFFLYAEQLARKEVEIAALRKHKRRLEEQLHQLQGRALAEEDRHRQEVEELRGQIQKSCRDKSREGANLEYLKNVLYRFLTLPDARGRQQTLTAILAVLHFSPEEKLSIAKSSAHGSWWLHGKR
ncbi:hypothetical protein DUI87_33379 [Hirundo rustica rustica]|uniref:GRIP domain-containing protein n=1 Tax=Hirundo rustica rustica TaxID=333673 RepID=A0A3M0ITQ2_HIRRU|nr:GRIP and coiled-coil domain-containing protein 1 [Hirundo rustica]RMB90243.1 hypothetical protein DUI87_33379 [Hirundo rustica rustica]